MIGGMLCSIDIRRPGAKHFTGTSPPAFFSLSFDTPSEVFTALYLLFQNCNMSFILMTGYCSIFTLLEPLITQIVLEILADPQLSQIQGKIIFARGAWHSLSPHDHLHFRLISSSTNAVNWNDPLPLLNLSRRGKLNTVVPEIQRNGKGLYEKPRDDNKSSAKQLFNDHGRK